MRALLILSVLILLGFTAPGIPAAQAQDGTPNVAQSLDYAFFGGGKIAVKVDFKRDLGETPDSFTIFYPANRVVLDFSNMRTALSSEPMKVRQWDLWGIQAVQSGSRVRLIIELVRPMIREMQVNGKELLIIFSRPELL